MSLQLTGTVKTILPIETGSKKDGGTWQKQVFVISFKDGSYDKELAVTVMKPELLASIAIGQSVTIDFNVSSREYNGRWYTDCQAWKINAGAGASNVPLPIDQQGSVDDLPF